MTKMLSLLFLLTIICSGYIINAPVQGSETASQISNPVSVTVKAPTAITKQNTTNLLLPIKVGTNIGSASVLEYQFTITYDPSVITITSVSKANTLSETMTVGYELHSKFDSKPGTLRVVAFGDDFLTNQKSTLLNLVIQAKSVHKTSLLTFTEFLFNEGNPKAKTTNGFVMVK